MSVNDLHARIAATILAQLETADPASWCPPWHGADPMPRNARTGRRYRDINVLALWCAAQKRALSREMLAAPVGANDTRDIYTRTIGQT